MPTAFSSYAGQLVEDGIGTDVPFRKLEEGGTALGPAETILGLLPKISRVFIEDTRIFGDPFGAVVRKVNDPLGAGIEMAGFTTGAVNKKRDGSCMPIETVALASQVAYSNWAYNIEVNLKDREINKGMVAPEDVGRYFSEKLKTPLKTVSQMHYRSWLQLLSDVIDGTRVIAGNTESDGTGAAQAYSPTVVGYAGHVENSAIVCAAPVAGAKSTISDAHALEFVTQMEAIASEFQYEGTAYNLLGIETFCVDKPLLFAETKSLNAIDVAWGLSAANKAVPTQTGREYLKRFCDIVEIDCFPALPTNALYPDDRLLGLMIDRDGLREIVKYADVESMRCANERATGYNFQGESIMAIYKGVNSYALLCHSA